MRSLVADLKIMGFLKARMSWLEAVKGAERVFLPATFRREDYVESAVCRPSKCLRGFEELSIEQSCTTGFGSARFEEGQQHYELAKYLCA
jgi:hypothetical protein|tara:strand:- start:206 stop:475 length:270 start_codon:yes stop_codon:yes gene_type:complete